MIQTLTFDGAPGELEGPWKLDGLPLRNWVTAALNGATLKLDLSDEPVAALLQAARSRRLMAAATAPARRITDLATADTSHFVLSSIAKRPHAES
jgi:hypothetical protein